MIQMSWTERTFNFDFPVEVFPGIIERLRGTPSRIADLVRTLPHNMLTRRVNDRWSVNEHIGHLVDLDDLDHVRLNEFIAHLPHLTAADMSNRRTYEAAYNDVVTSTLIDYFRARRLDLVQRLEALSDEEVARTALHPRLKMHMRVVDWVYFVAEHDDHHLARIRELI